MVKYLLMFKIVLDVLRAYKVRTTLAIAGVLLGTFAVVLVTSLTSSLEKKVQEEIDKFGDSLITVASGKVRRRSSADVIYRATSLKEKDLTDIIEEAAGVKTAFAYTSRPALITYGGITVSANGTGLTPEGVKLKKFTFASGTIYSDSDNDNMERVCIIGDEVRHKLFGNNDPIGQTVLIYRVPFRVVGLLAPMGSDLTGTSLDNVVIMPLKTHMLRVTNTDYLDGIMVQMYNYDDERQVISNIENILRRNHKLNGKDDDFDIISPTDTMRMRTDALKIVNFLGNTTASVSYLIGGLGIFSIMLLIVGQRKQEVGIRRAVGARRRDIIAQFLGESAFIGFCGGFLGGCFGVLICLLVYSTGKLPTAFSVGGGLTAFVSSLFIGVIAGGYPAYLASKVSPVDSLKS
jgi:putative ABC transport system permease protein